MEGLLKGSSEGDREKSTANRFGLLTIKQGLIEILVGAEIGPGPGVILVSSSHDTQASGLLKLDADGTYGETRVCELYDPGSEGV